jgi:hypothetical protein
LSSLNRASFKIAREDEKASGGESDGDQAPLKIFRPAGISYIIIKPVRRSQQMMKNFWITLILLLGGQSIHAAHADHQLARLTGRTSNLENPFAENSGKKRRRQRRHIRKRGQPMSQPNPEPKPLKNAPSTDRQPAHKNPLTDVPQRREEPSQPPKDRPAKDNP